MDYPSSVVGRLFGWISQKAFGIHIRVIDGIEVEEAKRILYRVYYNEQKWIPKKGNPSGLEIKDGKYEDHLGQFCTWVGIFQMYSGKWKMVGVQRFLNNPEMKMYMNEENLKRLQKYQNSCEVNRLAILKNFRNKWSFIFLIFYMCGIAEKRGFQYLTSSCQKGLSKYLQRSLGFDILFNFSYSSEEHPVSVVSRNVSGFANLLLAVRILVLIIKTKLSNYFSYFLKRKPKKTQPKSKRMGKL